MKFLALVAALLISKASTQYVSGGVTAGTNLPTLPGNAGSGSGSGSGLVNVNVPSFPNANLFDLSQVGLTSSVTTSQITSSVINSGRNELSTPVRSIPSLFTRFPSKTEIEKFADDGDVGGITKTLQVVAADDSVPCGTKITYLLELLGSVKNAIQRKTLVADQLQAVIEGAKAEIARLQDEINRTQKDRDALRLPDLDARVNDLSAKLTLLYSQINAVRDQIPPEEARIAGYEREVATLVKQNDGERNKITNDRLKLAQTDNLIKDLEARLQEARDTRAALQASITASENLIRDNQRKIDTIKSTIADINAKIKGLNDTADNLKRQANTLEVDLERARTDLSVAKVKDEKLANDIRNFQDQINAQQPKLVDDDLRNLRTIITNLNAVIPKINDAINREYYYCYGAGKVSTETVGSVIVYVVKGEAFGQYIQTAYGQSVAAPQLRSDGPDFRLNLVDPYSQIWTAKFGYPTLANKAGINAGVFPGDFSCLNAGGNSGSGRISAVNADGFVVNDTNGNGVRLNIGSCSRV